MQFNEIHAENDFCLSAKKIGVVLLVVLLHAAWVFDEIKFLFWD